MTNVHESTTVKYLVSSDVDLEWGVAVNTVGTLDIESDYPNYPPYERHPDKYFFDSTKGRILDEYQIVYITHGSGKFYTSLTTSVDVKAGDMFLLSPFVWHNYHPNKNSGWREYWIGFKGIDMNEKLVSTPLNRPVQMYRVGFHEDIIQLYSQAIAIAAKELSCYQQVLGGIVNHILGLMLYYEQNSRFVPTVSSQIERAKLIIHESIFESTISEDVAEMVGMSYSWFRQTFKEYTGYSPAKYIQKVKIELAKSMLSSSPMSVKEICFKLNYDNLSYFSVIFKRNTGLTPNEYRKLFTNLP